MTTFELHVPSSATGGVVTIGNFDGVHRGHQEMLSTVRRLASQRCRPAVVVTFDPHPITVLKPDVVLPRLSTIDIRTKLLKRFGADEVIVLPVSRQLLNMSPDQFFRNVIARQFKPIGMVEGPDFRFGKDRTGDTDVLRQLCADQQIELNVIPPVRSADTMISSSRIRRLLCEGDVGAAVEMLGHPYSVPGKVRHGAERGRMLGFPTANLAEVNVLLPCDGVYAAACRIGRCRYPVAMSIGPNPTFNDDSRKVECHVVGFSGDLYGAALSVDLITRVRSLIPFESADTLTEQIREDVAVCVKLFAAAEDLN